MKYLANSHLSSFWLWRLHHHLSALPSRIFSVHLFYQYFSCCFDCSHLPPLLLFISKESGKFANRASVASVQDKNKGTSALLYRLLQCLSRLPKLRQRLQSKEKGWDFSPPEGEKACRVPSALVCLPASSWCHSSISFKLGVRCINLHRYSSLTVLVIFHRGN